MTGGGAVPPPPDLFFSQLKPANKTEQHNATINLFFNNIFIF
jgi:hypothetical protein